jgi:LmbE family N-acetylglucosaminyl deacetylase
VCLTPGQAATHRGAAQNDHELATIRRNEFAASCKILGIQRGIVLDYADGQLYRAELHKVVCDVVHQVRVFRPHIMLSFGPEGGVTAHTDHTMASVFATLAFEWAGRNNRYPDQLTKGVEPHRTQKLYYSTANFVLAGRPPISPAPVTTVIPIGEYVETKIAAFAAHQSQAPVFPMVRDTILGRARDEVFHLAATSVPASLVAETDLFTGVKE